MKIKYCDSNKVVIDLEYDTMIVSVIGFGRILELHGDLEVTITFKKKS